MQQIIIKENEAGQRLDKFLAKYLNQAPKSFIYKMLRKKNIVLNGKKADGSEKLTLEDEVKLFLSDDTIEKFSKTAFISSEKAGMEADDVKPNLSKQILQKPEIIFENKHICLMNKPWAILSQKADKDDISMNEVFIQYMLDSKQITEEEMRTFKPSICNRLDRNTTGLMIGGKTLYGLQKMSQLLKERSVHKYYLCIVNGSVKGERQIEGYLVKDSISNQVKIYKEIPSNINNRKTNGGLKKADFSYIKTAYRTLVSNGQYSLLEILLVTGKTHQIRAHLATIGHPIIGDSKYGNIQNNRKMRDKYKLKNQLLHSYRLVVPNEVGILGEELKDIAGNEFLAPLPKLFVKIMEGEHLINGDMEFKRS